MKRWLDGLQLRWHFVRHTRPRQVLARLVLRARRGGRDLLPWRLRRSHGRPGDWVLADPLPRPVFPARTELVEWRLGVPHLCFLQLRHPWTEPYDWHPAGWNRGTRLEKLNLHALEFLEALDDRLFAASVAGWIEANPPGIPGCWRDAWNSWTLATRCVVWMQQFADRGARLSPGLRAKLAASLHRQISFLARNLELDLGGNHVVRDAKALLWASRFFRGPAAERWGRLAGRLLEREIAEQLLDDAMHFERSPAYHALVLADLLECASVLGPGPLRDRLTEALHGMSQVLADLTHPDGAVSLLNDGGLHMARSTATILAAYRQITGRSVEPRETIDLKAAGYFGLRRDRSFLVVDCGAVAPDHLPAHGHGDILSFEWDLDGQRMIVDAGVFEYHAGEWRAYSRSTRAHNTVTVDDADQCEFWSAFRVGRRPKRVRADRRFDAGWLVLEGSHDGYARLSGRPIHHRVLRTDLRQVAVQDRVEGGSGQTVRARLLCHPGCAVRPTDDGVLLEREHVTVRLRTTSRASVERAWWLPDFGLRLETSQIVLDYGRAPCSGRFMLERL